MYVCMYVCTYVCMYVCSSLYYFDNQPSYSHDTSYELRDIVVYPHFEFCFVLSITKLPRKVARPDRRYSLPRPFYRVRFEEGTYA